MIAYIPTPITSVKQAEALPEGTVLIREGCFAFQKHAGRFVSTDPHDPSVSDAWEVVGWTALMPVEAHTQDPGPVPGWGEHVRRHRYVTEWRYGPPPDRRGGCA